MRTIVAVLFVFILFSACSSRIVYDEPMQPTAANAININTASAEEIEKLPGIGRKTAEAIVRFREESGPFRRVEHLMQIRGVSEKRFVEIRQFLKTE